MISVIKTKVSVTRSKLDFSAASMHFAKINWYFVLFFREMVKPFLTNC